MSSKNTSSSKESSNVSKVEEKSAEKRPQQSQVNVLEEDDEFEEFEVQDWDDAQTELAHLGGTAPGAAKPGGDKLWEDNWDDDDVEDEFSVQLRSELVKTGQGTAGVAAAQPDSMQH